MRFGTTPPSPEQEKETLKGQAKWLEDELAAIRRRIEEVEKG
jgi:predicted  nucleic acid-binding Zn-ribbon protein